MTLPCSGRAARVAVAPFGGAAACDAATTAPGSAQDLTWTLVLPTNEAGTTGAQVGQVDSVGPTFWIGGTVTDPNSRFGQAFLELQFYPNSVTTNCASGGGYNVVYSANTY